MQVLSQWVTTSRNFLYPSPCRITQEGVTGLDGSLSVFTP